ncbi:MAG: TPM domain-containing protein [Oscillospiraceae bacterium]|jgi:uncharacterized protein|nr:TPM domain-containing protein [Oscillospiraceae bacterium]
MKKITFCLIVLVLAVSLALPVCAYSAGLDASLPRVIDNADLLTSAEEETLETRLIDLAELRQFDIVIRTEQSIGGTNLEEYADDFFDYQNYGWHAEDTDDITTGDGILFLLNMETRDWHISTKGTGIAVFSDYTIASIGNNMLPDLGGGNYESAFQIFLDDVEEHLDSYASSNGADDAYNNYDDGYETPDYGYYDDSDDFSRNTVTRTYNLGALVFGLILACAAAGIAAHLLFRQMNTAVAQSHATGYVLQNGFRLTNTRDIFLYSTTSSVRIQSNDIHTNHHGGGFSGGGFSGGGFSGGSSTHVSSSGSTHGGGGGHF